MSANVQEAVAYIRVSRPRQARSGLDLEAQQAAIAAFAKAQRYRIAEAFSEVETGKGADALERRPELAKAIRSARSQARQWRPQTGAACLPELAYNFSPARDREPQSP